MQNVCICVYIHTSITIHDNAVVKIFSHINPSQFRQLGVVRRLDEIKASPFSFLSFSILLWGRIRCLQSSNELGSFISIFNMSLLILFYMSQTHRHTSKCFLDHVCFLPRLYQQGWMQTIGEILEKHIFQYHKIWNLTNMDTLH